MKPVGAIAELLVQRATRAEWIGVRGQPPTTARPASAEVKVALGGEASHLARPGASAADLRRRSDGRLTEDELFRAYGIRDVRLPG